MWPFNLFKRKHKCSFDKPIASSYVSFNTRDILFECSCGKRNIETVIKAFDSSFPIQTTMFLSRKDIERMRDNAEVFGK